MAIERSVVQPLFQGSPPRAVLFDLDGTLVDSAPDLAMAVNKMLHQLNLPEAPEPLIGKWIGKGAELLVQKALAYAEAPERYEHGFSLFIQHYEACNGKHAKPFAGILKGLQHLKASKIPCWVVTNKIMVFTTPLLEQLEMAHYFEGIVAGDCVAQKKPYPDSILLACEKLCVSPSEVLMVGDSKNDVLAAKAAGCPVIAVDYGYNHGEDIRLSEPDGVVSSIEEVFCFTEDLG